MVERKKRPDTDAILEAAHHWMMRLESPDVTAGDQTEFERWLSSNPRHRDIYDQALTFREAIGRLSTNDLEEDIARRSGTETLTAALDKLRKRSKSARYRIAAASFVSIAAATFLAPMLFPAPTTQIVQTEAVIADYSSEIGETKSIELPDGTVITLGADTELKSAYSSDRRTVELVSGSGYFDIAPDADRPFSVEAGDLIATALGTEFDVRRGADSITLAVAEGSVAVTHPIVLNGSPTSMRTRRTLNVGEQVIADSESGMQSTAQIDADKIGAWREGRLVYSGALLSEVLFDANRYSEISIEIADGSEQLKKVRLRGVFRGNDIDRLLTNISQLHPVEIDRSDPDKIVLREKQ